MGKGSKTGKEIGKLLGLHPRGIWDFLDGLVAMGFLEREGNGNEAKYLNTAQTSMFLDKKSPDYIGGILEMAGTRLYRYWGDLTEALRTGQPQNEIKYNEKNIFEVLYQDPHKLEEFMKAMTGLSKRNFESFGGKFDFSRYQTLCDIGGAVGLLSILVAKVHPNMRCVS